ncbi:hypothetical protein F5X99DRAFT_366786 [Biscogniauxia marginata]|nr:hypothetical protein F5X99DRAFT_366786 [Biscogniauxia marginata]
MPSPNLTNVPLEILLQITSYLTIADYGAVRLTCKQIEDSLFRSFAHNYFRKMQFMRTDFSLQALIDISQSRLAPFLKHVVIGTEILDPGVCHIPISADYRRRTDGRTNVTANEIKYNKFSTMCADQVVLLSTGHDQQMLSEAFSNLNLDVIGIRSPPVYGPAPRDACTSLGTAKVHRETSIDLKRVGIYYGWGGDARDSTTRANVSCVHNILSALGKSGLSPKKLETTMGGILLGDDAFIIPSFMQKTLLPVLSKLEELDIKVDGSSTRYRQIIAPAGESPYKVETYYLRNFLSHLTHLERLHLQLSLDYDGFFSWLGSPPSIEDYRGPPGFEPPGSPVFAHLSELTLTKCTIPVEDMLHIVRKFSRTLRKLSLHQVTLSDGALRLLNHEPRVDIWVGFLTKLARIGRDIREIHFNDPAQRSGNAERGLLFRDGEISSPHFSYTGPNMREELESLSQKVKIPESHWYLRSPFASDEEFYEDDFPFNEEDDDFEYDEYDGFDEFADVIDPELTEELLMAAALYP